MHKCICICAIRYALEIQCSEYHRREGVGTSLWEDPEAMEEVTPHPHRKGILFNQIVDGGRRGLR